MVEGRVYLTIECIMWLIVSCFAIDRKLFFSGTHILHFLKVKDSVNFDVEHWAARFFKRKLSTITWRPSRMLCGDFLWERAGMFGPRDSASRSSQLVLEPQRCLSCMRPSATPLGRRDRAKRETPPTVINFHLFRTLLSQLLGSGTACATSPPTPVVKRAVARRMKKHEKL